MMQNRERKTRIIDWGDGHRVKVTVPKLTEIPGNSVVCPMPCHPVGEDEKEWKTNEEKTKKPHSTA